MHRFERLELVSSEVSSVEGEVGEAKKRKRTLSRQEWKWKSKVSEGEIHQKEVQRLEVVG